MVFDLTPLPISCTALPGSGHEILTADARTGSFTRRTSGTVGSLPFRDRAHLLGDNAGPGIDVGPVPEITLGQHRPGGGVPQFLTRVAATRPATPPVAPCLLAYATRNAMSTTSRTTMTVTTPRPSGPKVPPRRSALPATLLVPVPTRAPLPRRDHFGIHKGLILREQSGLSG